jgi:hypothetical protein
MPTTNLSRSPNKNSISWHGGIGFSMLPNGDRQTQFMGVVHIVEKNPAGWSLAGQIFKTLADVSKHINKP